MALWDWTGGPRGYFVVDTEEYAGNFERELCGFVCGQYDDYGDPRGGFYKAMYLKEHPDDPFESLIGQMVDDPGDDGIHRAPMALAPTPGWINDGHGKHIKLDEATHTELRKAKKRYPAYNSVAICLTRKPKDKELKLLVERAMKFSSAPKRKDWSALPKVTGCRLVEESTVLKETNLT